MNMKLNKSIVATLLCTVALMGCKSTPVEETILVPTPPMGWNSFDSYGTYLYEDAAMKNLEAFAEKLAPHGYKYYVIDAGWFGEYNLVPGTLYPAEKHAKNLNINEYGLLQPSKTYFPNGLKPIADRCHELGLKFGVHIMRGIPRVSVKKNTPVKGTEYHAQDIADTTSICKWCEQNYGVDMTRPGAQAFYDSWIAQLAEWGVDFIKADDIVPFPAEVGAVAKGIKNCGRDIVLSLSPGGFVDDSQLDFFKMANMLRVTHDIWDEQIGLDQCFKAWRKWQGKEGPNFFIDMDMIPFGELQVMSPVPAGLNGSESHAVIKQMKKDGKLKNVELLSGKGFHRQSQFTQDEMRTFITMRALAASPLMMGGNLLTIDDFSLSLLTNAEMIACNQNAVMGSLKYDQNKIEIWNTPKKNSNEGWIGVFNRNAKEPQQYVISTSELGLANDQYVLKDIWGNAELSFNQEVLIPANGVIFIKYTNK
jgi:alpha-galactosidase